MEDYIPMSIFPEMLSPDILDFFLVFLRPKNHFLVRLAGLSKNEKENECEGQDDLQVFTFCLPSRSAAPGKIRD